MPLDFGQQSLVCVVKSHGIAMQISGVARNIATIVSAIKSFMLVYTY
jgi:hypothetical protein